MQITKDDVHYVAHLARIQLEPQQRDKLAIQLEDILDFIDHLKQVNVSQVAPTSHIMPINNIWRDDQLRPSLDSNNVLSNAPQKSGDFFGVPKVI